MRLRHWTYAVRDVELDPVSGRGRTVPLAAPVVSDVPIAGFAASERTVWGRRTWFAVYRVGDAVVLQVGARRFALGDPSLELEHRRLSPAFSRFTVREGGAVVFQLRYWHPGRLVMALIDPTYDGIDQETDFFLEFLAERADDTAWRERVLTQWVEAGS